MSKTTWSREIIIALEEHKESWDDVVSSTLTNEQLNTKFDNGYGLPEGCAFTVWTNDFVYFPLCYNGLETVGCIPRNPNGISTPHQGRW